MCAQCLSQSEFVVAKVALAAALLKEPVHNLLASMGVVDRPVVEARDARTIAFLRSLDLDPVGVLGAATVDAADEWVAAGAYGRLGDERRIRAAASARPMGSHKRLAV